MNDQQKNDLKVFRILAFFWDSLFMSIVPALFGMALAAPLGRPYYEGLIFGLFAGVALVISSLTNSAIKERWLHDTEENYKEAEAESDREWREEQNRADDEYVGW